MSDGRLGYVAVARVSGSGIPRTEVPIGAPTHATFGEAARERDKLQAYFQVEMQFYDGDITEAEHYSYQVAELVIPADSEG